MHLFGHYYFLVIIIFWPKHSPFYLIEAGSQKSTTGIRLMAQGVFSGPNPYFGFPQFIATRWKDNENIILKEFFVSFDSFLQLPFVHFYSEANLSPPSVFNLNYLVNMHYLIVSERSLQSLRAFAEMIQLLLLSQANGRDWRNWIVIMLCFHTALVYNNWVFKNDFTQSCHVFCMLSIKKLNNARFTGM